MGTHLTNTTHLDEISELADDWLENYDERANQYSPQDLRRIANDVEVANILRRMRGLAVAELTWGEWSLIQDVLDSMKACYDECAKDDEVEDPENVSTYVDRVKMIDEFVRQTISV